MISSGGAAIADGGWVSETTVLGDGVEILSAAFGTMVESGGVEEFLGGGTTVGAGGVQIVLTGIASDTAVQSGGLEIVGDVASGGVLLGIGEAEGTVVLGGGEIIVSSGDAVGSAIISTGATIAVLSPGWTRSTTILRGAVQGQGDETSVRSSGCAVQIVSSRAIASGTLQRRYELVRSGGSAGGSMTL